MTSSIKLFISSLLLILIFPVYVNGEGYYQRGLASWYGKTHHGKKTASGDKFNMYDNTAAHRTLPFGSMLLVRNVENNKEVIVHVNDRGPFYSKRIIDLSFASASALEITDEGLGVVEIDILYRPKNK